MKLTLLAAFFSASAFAADPIRVLVWDEQQPTQKTAYGGKFLGETIGAHLEKLPGISVNPVNPASPEQGLDAATLDATDVVIWWGHQKHRDVKDEFAERVVQRVQDGRLGLVALHSAHWAKPFVRLMQERAKADALAQIPAAERTDALIEFANAAPIGRLVKADTELTPFLEKMDVGKWRLTLPQCVFPAWRADGAPSHMTTLLPEHPLAAGLPRMWDVKQTEMYTEPFHVPSPDAVVFEEKWDKGEHFRSGCVWRVGKGRVIFSAPATKHIPCISRPNRCASWRMPCAGSRCRRKSSAPKKIARAVSSAYPLSHEQTCPRPCHRFIGKSRPRRRRGTAAPRPHRARL